jgi:hypothetical protein
MLFLLERLNLLENRHVNVNSGSWHDAVMLNYVASDIKPPAITLTEVVPVFIVNCNSLHRRKEM